VAHDDEGRARAHVGHAGRQRVRGAEALHVQRQHGLQRGQRGGARIGHGGRIGQQRGIEFAVEAGVAQVAREQVDGVAAALDLAVGALDLGLGAVILEEQRDHAGDDQQAHRHGHEQFGEGKAGGPAGGRDDHRGS
jgi:hypothetical protein